METLKTATGRQFKCEFFNVCEPVNRLTIRIVDTSVPEVAKVFSNPKEIEALWCGHYYAASYSGLVSIMPEGTAVRVTLKKE